MEKGYIRYNEYLEPGMLAMKLAGWTVPNELAIRVGRLLEWIAQDSENDQADFGQEELSNPIDYLISGLAHFERGFQLQALELMLQSWESVMDRAGNKQFNN